MAPPASRRLIPAPLPRSSPQATVPADVRLQLDEIEREQSFEELSVLRKVAMARVKRQRDLVEVGE